MVVDDQNLDCRRGKPRVFLVARLPMLLARLSPLSSAVFRRVRAEFKQSRTTPPAENRDANRDLNRLSGEPWAYGQVAIPFCETQFNVGGGIGGTVEP